VYLTLFVCTPITQLHDKYWLIVTCLGVNIPLFFITESENTFRLQKEYIPLMVQKYYKPDGWLGALLGTRIFIDFSGKYQFQTKWKELVKELRVHNILPDQHASEQKTTGTYCI